MDGDLGRHRELIMNASGSAASALFPSLKHSGPIANHVLSTVHPAASSTLAHQAELSSAGWGHNVQYSAGSTFEAVFRPPSAAAAAAAAAGAAQAAGLTLPHISPDDIMQLVDYFGEDDIEAFHQQMPSASNSAACTADLSHHSGIGCSSNSTPSMPNAAAAYFECADLSNLSVPDQLPVYPLQQQHYALDHTFSVNSWQTASSPETPATGTISGVVPCLEYPCMPTCGQGNSSLRSSTTTGGDEHMWSKHLASLAAQPPSVATTAAAATAAAAVSAGSAGESGTQGPPASPASPPAAAATATAARSGRGAAAGAGATTPASRRRERTAAPAAINAVDQRREVNRLTQQRLRRERQAEHMKLRDQLAIMTDQVTRLQASFRSQQASHSELLSRLGEVTGKWRDSVAENARLSADNVAVRTQVADLQMQLMMYQAQQHQQQQHWSGM